MNTNASNALLKNLEIATCTHSVHPDCPFDRPPVADPPFAVPDHFFSRWARKTFFRSLRASSRACRTNHNEGSRIGRAAGSPRHAILLTQYGGLEISAAVDRLVASQNIDVAQAHRLADAVAARNQAIQFGIFNRHFLDVVADAASRAAQAGDLQVANRSRSALTAR